MPCILDAFYHDTCNLLAPGIGTFCFQKGVCILDKCRVLNRMQSLHCFCKLHTRSSHLFSFGSSVAELATSSSGTCCRPWALGLGHWALGLGPSTRSHPDPTTGRWCREPLLARVAWDFAFAFGTWQHSEMKFNGLRRP